MKIYTGENFALQITCGPSRPHWVYSTGVVGGYWDVASCWRVMLLVRMWIQMFVSLHAFYRGIITFKVNTKLYAGPVNNPQEIQHRSGGNRIHSYFTVSVLCESLHENWHLLFFVNGQRTSSSWLTQICVWTFILLLEDGHIHCDYYDCYCHDY